MVVHRRAHLLRGEVDVGASALLPSLPHEGRFVGEFVRVGAGLPGEDLV